MNNLSKRTITILSIGFVVAAMILTGFNLYDYSQTGKFNYFNLAMVGIYLLHILILRNSRQKE